MKILSLKNTGFFLLHGIGFLLLYFVIRDLEFREILQLSATVPLIKLLSGLALLLAVYFIKAFRWLLINRAFGVDMSYGSTLLIYLITGFLSSITPGRIGEFAKIYFLKKKHQIDYSKATSSVILDRVWDILVLSMMAGISILMFFSGKDIPVLSLGLIVLFFLLSLALIIFPDIFFKPLLSLTKKKVKLNERIQILYQAWKGKNIFILLISFLLSLASFFCLAVIPVIFSNELGAPVRLLAGIGSVSISNILSYLPITVAGFGTRELVFVNIWAMMNYSKEIAISVSSLQFIITYVGSILIGGFLYLVKFRKLFKIKDIRKVEV